MRLHTIRQIILFFAVGFSWGFVTKTLFTHYTYTGHDDPQVISIAPLYDVDRVIDPPTITGALKPSDSNRHLTASLFSNF